jgi:hypothetical protein
MIWEGTDNNLRSYVQYIISNGPIFPHHLIAKLCSLDRLNTTFRIVIPKSERLCNKYKNSAFCHSALRQAQQPRSEESSFYTTFWILRSLRFIRMTIFYTVSEFGNLMNILTSLKASWFKQNTYL